MANGVRLKSYIDALNAETRRTNNMRGLAIAGASAVMFFNIIMSIQVFSRTNQLQFNLHNDLIRKTAADHAAVKMEMATKAEVEPLRTYIDSERGGSTMSGKFWGALAGVGTLATMVGFGLANLIGAG